jgi:beta-glucosidase
MAAERLPYQDASRSVSDRVADLVSRMSLDEKLAQIGCVWSTQLVEADAFSEQKARELLHHGTGHVTRIGASTGLRPPQSAAFMNTIQRFLVEETRLGIPAIVHEESCAGFTARDATQFPQAIGLAATFEPEGVEAMGRVIRDQMLAVGARHTLAPVLDVTRDPRWGRTEETYGEDPYLASRMGVAYVRGVQGDDLRQGVVATGKHFLGYGASEGGLNHAPAHIGPRELREVYARPFEAAIREAGLASVMNAYNEIDGLPCAGSKAILDDLLRGELGFEGVVVADYYSTRLLQVHHHVASSPGEAGQRALEAGIDVELPALECYGAPLAERVRSGALSESLVDRALRRLLRMKFELGLFEDPYVDAEQSVSRYDLPEQRDLARRLAAKSIVLLKNEADLLPLDPGLSSLALIGPCADDVRLLLGDYHYPAHVEIVYKRQGAGADIAPAAGNQAFAAGPYYRPMVSLLEGVRGAVAPETRIQVARGCDVTGDDDSGIAEAVSAARAAEVAILAVGGKSGLLPDCTSGEFRDASDLGLTGLQQRLVEEVAATGTRCVVVLVNGRPLALPWIAEHVDALLEAWLPGEQGGHAVADVLFGRTNPAGRLPISIPRSVGQVPVFAGHKSGGGRSQMLGDYVDGPTRPLFPFGFGLSYTSFAYGELGLDPATPGPFDLVRIGVDVANVGERAGDEVVQLYLRDVVASCTRPVRQLAGFVRVALEAGQVRRVVFHLDPTQLAFYDPDMRLVVEPGEIRVFVGASSQDVRAEGRFEIQGPRRELGSAEIGPTSVELLAPTPD